MVLPWVPPTAIVRFMRESSPSRSPRWRTRRARRPCRRQLRVVLGDRGGDHHLGARGQVGRVVADDGLDAGGAQPLAVGRLGLVGARDARAELLRHERQAAHAGAADAYEVEGAAGEGRIGSTMPRDKRRPAGPSVCSGRAWADLDASSSARPRAQHSSAIRSAASGRATARAAFAISAIRCGAASRRADLAGQPRAVELAVRDDHGRAGLLHEAGVRGLVVGRWRADRARGSRAGRRPPARTPSHRRAPRPGRRRPGRPRTARCSGRAGSAAASRARRAACAGRRSRAGRRRAARQHGARTRTHRARLRSSRRAPSEPPKTSRHGTSGATPEASARSDPISPAGARRNRPPGDEVLRAARGPRAGTQEHAARERSEQPVRHPEMAVRLRQRQGSRASAPRVPPARPRSRRRRAPRRRRCAAAAAGPARVPAPRGATARRGAEWVLPVDARHAQRMERIAGGRHELRLRALASDELDVGAPRAVARQRPRAPARRVPPCLRRRSRSLALPPPSIARSSGRSVVVPACPPAAPDRPWRPRSAAAPSPPSAPPGCSRRTR